MVWIIVENVVRKVHRISLDERIGRALDAPAARIEDHKIAARRSAVAVAHFAVKIVGQLVGPFLRTGRPIVGISGLRRGGSGSRRGPSEPFNFDQRSGAGGEPFNTDIDRLSFVGVMFRPSVGVT